MRTKSRRLLQRFSDGVLIAILIPAAIALQGARANEQVLKSFGNAVFREGRHPRAALIQGIDGALYGTTLAGGTNSAGTIFKLNLDGTSSRILHEFGGSASDGRQPSSALVQDTSGTIYGTTSGGGTNSYGTVFQIKPDGSSYAVLYAFQPFKRQGTPNFTNFNFPTLTLGSDGGLYGTTSGGGTNDLGTVFRLNPDGSGFNVLHTLAPQIGLQHQGALIEGVDGMFYGTTPLGGTKGLGNVFKLNRDGTAYSIIYTFGATANDAAQPEAPLVQDSDGTLYGTTAAGGFYGFGTIFHIRPDGSDYRVALDFQGPGTLGTGIQAGLLKVGDGWLYGVFPGGGVAPGQVFRFSPMSSAFEVLHDFSLNPVLNDGSHPQSELMLATNAMLYGTTYDGGANGLGTVYRSQIDGHGFAIVYSFGLEFGDGADPVCALTQGQDGALYGTTSRGGTNGVGIVFKLGPDGTGYQVLHGFEGGTNDGANPGPGVVLGPDNGLYGVTPSGGTSNAGTIYRLDQDGANYHVLHHFGTSPDDGTAPAAALLAGIGGVLYGSTSTGGPSNAGTIFRIHLSGNGYCVVHSFVGGPDDGANPSASLVQAADGTLYGTSHSGGVSGAGTVFKLRADGTGFSLLHSFSFSTHEGYFPGGLVIGNNCDLYGVTSLVAPGRAGSVFRIKPDGSGFTEIYNFSNDPINGNWPQAPLIQSMDGTFYGTTPFNQTNKPGIAFRLNPDGTGFAALHQFGTVLNGGHNPESALLIGMDGALYGTTANGGSYGSGTIYRLTTVPYVPPPPFVLSIGAAATGFHLSTAGVVGKTFTLEASTDLLNWFSLGSVSNETGMVDFLDWSGSKGAQRFYRMLAAP